MSLWQHKVRKLSPDTEYHAGPSSTESSVLWKHPSLTSYCACPPIHCHFCDSSIYKCEKQGNIKPLNRKIHLHVILSLYSFYANIYSVVFYLYLLDLKNVINFSCHTLFLGTVKTYYILIYLLLIKNYQNTFHFANVEFSV